MPDPGDEVRYERHRRWFWLSVVFGIALAVSLVGLVFVPFHKVSQELQLVPGGSASSDVSVPQATWLTITFQVALSGNPPPLVDTANLAGWSFWIRGPSGMTSNESNTLGDYYSFWTWGGTYHYGAAYAGGGSGTVGVWVNATWGVL